MSFWILLRPLKSWTARIETSKSFRQALRTVWKRDKIDTFQVDWNIDYIVFVIYVGGDSSLWQVGGGTRRSYSYNLQEL